MIFENDKKYKYVFRIWQVTNSVPDTQMHYVAPIGYDEYEPSEPVLATFVSQVPVDGINSGTIYNVKAGTPVMVMLEVAEGGIISHAYILGFAPLLTTRNTMGQGFKPMLLDTGDTANTEPNGSYFLKKANGLYEWFVGNWAQFRLSKVSQILSGLLQGVNFILRGGMFQWSWNRDTDNTTFKAVITKTFLGAGDAERSLGSPIEREAPMDGSDEYSDNVSLRLAGSASNGTGGSEPGRIAWVETRQAKGGGKTANVFTRLKVGRNNENIAIIDSLVWDKRDGKRVVIKVVGDDQLEITSEIDTNPLAKASIKFGIDGSITIGGAGSEQALVTKSFLENFYATHVHIGNMGAPTSPPVVPVAPLLITAADNPANIVTHSLKGE